MTEKYLAYNEINELLDSNEESDIVEKKSTDILSKKLYEYSLDEIKAELEKTELQPEVDITEEHKISREKMDENFKEFIGKLKVDPKLEFIKDFKKEFPESKIYLVGGAVRDGFMGKEIKDYDMVVAGVKGDDLEKYLSKIGRVDLVGKNFGVYKFKNEANKEYLDLVLPRQEKSGGSGARRDFEIESNWQLPIEKDLLRRDFTINAMALELENFTLNDPYHGKEDLENGVIRGVGNPEDRFSEDLSRMLRGIRFAAKMGYKIDSETWEAIKKKSVETLKTDKTGRQIVPWEIISTELEKSFIVDPVRTFDMLDKSGLMNQILPEIEKLKGLNQPPEHHKEGDVFTHTRLALKALPANSPISLVFAALFHDVGKPETLKIDEHGKITFHGHAEKSANLTKEICSRFRITSELTDKIYSLVDKHMVMFNAEVMTKAKIYKLLFETIPNETSHELMRLNKADLLASVADEKKSYDFARDKITEFNEKTKEKEIEIQPFVSGKDLIGLGLTPGPIFKKILDKIRDQQLEGNIKSKDEAMSLANALKNELIQI